MNNINATPQYFYQPNQFGWTKILQSHYLAIKQEWHLSPKHIRRPQKEIHRGKTIEKADSKWDLVLLMDRDKVVADKRSLFPITMSLISQLPIYENLAFSVFYPGTETVPHKGWSKDIVRVHLAIETNSGAALCCGGQSVSLKNGEILIFEDGEEHYAYNRSDQERTILMFDVLKKNLQLAP